MRRIAPMMTALLGTTVLAVAAHANDSKGPVLDTIYTSPSTAQSPALELLREDYDVVTIDEDLPTPLEAGHVVVSGVDLEDPNFASLLWFGRRIGRTVAIVDATQEEADSFARRFGASESANCAPAEGSSTIELYGLQETRARRPAISSSYCLAGLEGLKKKGELDVRRWLRERFDLSAPEPTPGQSPVTAAQSATSPFDILELATATHCSFNSPPTQTSMDGIGFELDVYVTGVRVFNSSQDIYYVQSAPQYTQGTSTSRDYTFAVEQFRATDVPSFSSGMSNTSPATDSVFVSSLSLSSSTTESGSVGFNAEGPTGTVGGSATQGQTVTLSVPPIIIANQSVDPLPSWLFTRQSNSGQTFAPEMSWLWTVPWASYADQGEGTAGRLIFASRLLLSNITPVNPYSCSVPYPFGGITTIDAPTVTDVSPESVATGGPFTITGAGLYPGLVNAVLLGGTALENSDFTVNGETATGSGVYTISVVVPDTQPTGENTVVVQQEFNGNQQFSPDDVTIDVTD